MAKHSVTTNSQLGLWGEHELTAEPQSWSFGPLALWCRLLNDELWIAHQHIKQVESEVNSRDSASENLSWSRWVLKRETHKIRFVPAFPDRPLVVKPEYPFRLMQGARARIYVRVPLWVRIEQSGREGQLIVEEPSVILSKTWFGTPTSGDLCYWISTSARREMRPDPSRPFMAISPLLIQNNSEVDLNVEKWALRVDRLSIFEHQGQLWSDEMKIEYLGKDEVSQIKMSGKPPAEAASAHLLNRPRNISKRGFAAKTFSTIKDISGLDLLLK